MIQDNKIFEKLILTKQFQFIERSQEFLRFLADTDVITVSEIDGIWDIIQNGLNEEKLQMKKIFKQIMRYFKQEKKTYILD